MDEFTCELTEILDNLLPAQNKSSLGFFTYIMEHSKKEDGGTIYAIRYPGATRGSIVTDSTGTIVQILLDETFYGKGAYDAVKKYIGVKFLFDEE